jgi:hypothetical protein
VRSDLADLIQSQRGMEELVEELAQERLQALKQEHRLVDV